MRASRPLHERIADRLPGAPPSAASVAAWIVPFALILYLALSNGGYGIEERSYVGALAWLAAAVACVVSADPRRGLGRGVVVSFSLLAGFALWTALSMIWTENGQQTSIEVGRVVSYLGVFVLAVALQSRGHVREVIAGTTMALAVVCGLALLSRMEPNWFPERVSGQFLQVPEIERRLAYPLNYSGGIATLVTMTLPLLLAQTWVARSRLTRLLSAAALPMVLVALWLTGSGLLLAVSWIGVTVFLSLSERRVRHLITLSAGLLGGTVLSFAVVSLESLDRGLPTPAALAEGDRLLIYTVAVMACAAGVQYGLERFADRVQPPEWIRTPNSRRRLAVGASVTAVAALSALLLTGVVDSGIDRFQSRDNVPAEASRLVQVSDLSSSGRYQQWQAALDANASEPLVGIGAGTFEFWWSRNGLYSGYVRDAHSLYLETLGELGILGLVLIAGFLAAVIYLGARRALRAGGQERVLRAGAVGLIAAFAASAGVDWMWELGVLPVATMLLAAGACMPWSRDQGSAEPALGAPALKLGLPALALVALVLIAIPALTEMRLNDSEERFREGDLDGAFSRAEAAESLSPFAAGPRLQQAFVLREAGELDRAITAAQEAVEKAPTDWRPLLILSQLQNAVNDPESAQQSFDLARSLNPRSQLFAPG